MTSLTTIPKEVNDWLEEFNLSQFGTSMIEEGFIAIADIIAMDDEDIAACGITKRGDIKRFKRAAGTIGTHKKSTSSSCKSVSTLKFGTSLMRESESMENPESKAARNSTTTGIGATMIAEALALASENKGIVAKLKTGTATRNDIARLKEIKEKIADLSVSKEHASKIKSMKVKSEIKTAKRELKIKVRKKELEELEQLIIESQQVDLCFMFDATGSMASYINGVKAQIRAIVAKVKRSSPDLVLRVSVVAYRDFDCSPSTEMLPFSKSISTFESFLGSIQATGGGDEAEDVASGLRLAVDLPWEYSTRVLFHIADAPSHGSCYHKGAGDDHSNGDHGIPDLLRSLNRKNVDYHFGEINISTRHMIKQFNADVGSEDFISVAPIQEGITKAVTKSIAASISRTVTRLSTMLESGTAMSSISEKSEENHTGTSSSSYEDP